MNDHRTEEKRKYYMGAMNVMDAMPAKPASLRCNAMDNS